MEVQQYKNKLKKTNVTTKYLSRLTSSAPQTGISILPEYPFSAKTILPGISIIQKYSSKMIILNLTSN